MAGFGSQPGDFGDAGVPVPPPPENVAEQTSADIHAIRVKVVDGATNFRVPLQLAINGGVRQDMTDQPVNAVILTGVTGLIFGYLTDQSPNFTKAAFLPDFVVSAGVVPTSVQVMIPERKDYIFSFQEGSGTAAAAGTARLMKI